MNVKHYFGVHYVASSLHNCVHSRDVNDHCVVLDGRCNLDIHPHHITCLTWPVSRGLLESQVGIVDSLLVGRIDGSLAVVEMFDRNSFTRVEMDQCSRQGSRWIMAVTCVEEGTSKTTKHSFVHV